ncbi:hypothetical protein HII36_16405 [Nonomuraea sp. NN258]|uniref:hypothetical protein n=1 Tax=Nonomuraea antri TaxID=2730852 RepID=UPI00156A4770|nr:hypothetical protein [Nonomuraea antri]NRQ33417.1 hypothetical protein [Nonomuraea antri]
MRRLTLLALVSSLALTACAADPAVQDAHDRLDLVADQLTGYDPWIPEDVGYHLTRDEEYVTVLDVSGDGRGDPGRVRIRVRGRDRTPQPPRRPEDVPATPSPAAVVFLCFELKVLQPMWGDRSPVRKPDRRVDVTEIDCPAKIPPRTFRPPAVLPAHTDAWLKKHLPTTLDLDAARRAVQGLDLDPRIRQDVAEHDGRIGVALRMPDGGCLFARVWPSIVQVWSPWRPWAPPVLPAERACSAAQAASGYSY